MDELRVKTDNANWDKLFKAGSMAAMLIALLMLGEIFVYACIPNRDNPIEIFELFQRNAFAGLLFFDLLGIISYLLFIPFIISLYRIMKNNSPGLLTIGTILFFIGITVFFANNTGFSILSLSNQFKIATSQEEKAMLIAACKTMMTLFDVNAFMVSYVLVSLSWSMISYAMFDSKLFSRSTAFFGLLAGVSGILAEIIENTMKQFLIVAISCYFLAIVFLIVWVVKSGLTLYKIGFQGKMNGD